MCLCVHMLPLDSEASNSRMISCLSKSEHSCTQISLFLHSNACTNREPRHEPATIGYQISLQTRQQV